ncbi:MAG: site-2 protease family protein [Anaerolineae bacterium]|nr:site-2 protease family protein [Anaerolineae bacterium]
MSLPNTHSEILTSLIARYFDIQDITWGTDQQKFVVRYRGKLTQDSAKAYDQLAEALHRHNLTPLFRQEHEQDIILLMAGVVQPQPTNTRTNLVLFLLTLFSMLLAGAFYSYEGPPPDNEFALYASLFRNLGSGWPFASSLLAILLAHEFGHYLAARHHHTPVTLPYFLPLPLLGGFGTLGAFIQLKAPPKNKNVLLDIGIAGPLAGLVIAIPVVLYGLSLSELGAIPLSFAPGEGSMLEGNSILYLLSKYLVHGQLLPAPISYQGVSPILYWLRYYFTGLPAPLGGTDVFMHPIAWAGWAGLLVTALNLIPAGQLDGGHVLYVLFGKNAQRIRPYILVTLMLLGMMYSGWWLWAAIIYFLGRQHAEPLDQITPLSPRRKIVAVLMLLVFILVFTPVPLRIIGATGL